MVAVVVSTFFVGFGGGVVFPILPNLGTVIGISPFLVGVILSANRFTRIVANAPAGSLIDRIGTRTPLVAGMLVETVGTLGYVVAMGSSLPAAWFVGARIVWGLGSAMVFATAYTIAADVSDEGSRGMSMGIVRGGIMLGFPSGLVMGGVVSDVYGITAAFGAAAGLAFLATLVAYELVPETHVSGHQTAVRPWELDTSLPTLTIGLVNFAIFFVYLGALFATLVLFLGENGIGVWGYGPQGMSGLMMAVTVLSATGFTIGGGRVSDVTGSRMPTLFVFLAVTAGGFLALSMADTLPQLVFACVLIGAGQGGTSGPLMALLADLTPADRTGRAMGTNNVFGDLGGALGPMVALPLVDPVGFAALYAACAVVPVFAGVVLVGGVYHETGSVRPQTAPRSGD